VLLVEKDNLRALIPGMKVATFPGAAHFVRTMLDGRIPLLWIADKNRADLFMDRRASLSQIAVRPS